VVTVRKPNEPPARQNKVTETLVAGPALGQVSGQPMSASHLTPSHQVQAHAETVASNAGFMDADAAITVLYSAHYRPLVRLAAFLVHDVATAEEVVQDSFVALHAGLYRLRDNEKALAYLRAAVVNRSRSVLRHRVVVDRNAPKPAPAMPSAEHGAFALIERSEVVAALRDLPMRQREVVVLRFYADLSEAQIATTMGITKGAVKSHTSRAMSALRSVLGRDV
jgi:RNA polymerase sigma-70 factor (sigma-E family)